MIGYIAIVVTLAFIILGFLFVHELWTTYTAHDTFSGYCQWRGETPLYSSNDTGVCLTQDGTYHNITMMRGRWYLQGDGPTQIDYTEQSIIERCRGMMGGVNDVCWTITGGGCS